MRVDNRLNHLTSLKGLPTSHTRTHPLLAMNLDSGSGWSLEALVCVWMSGTNNLGGSQPNRSEMLMAGLRKNAQKTAQVLEEPWLGAKAKRPSS